MKTHNREELCVDILTISNIKSYGFPKQLCSNIFDLFSQNPVHSKCATSLAAKFLQQISNFKKRDYFTFIVGSFFVIKKLYCISEELLKEFPDLYLYNAKTADFLSNKLERYTSLKKLYLQRPYYCTYYNNYKYFVRESIRYNDFECIIHQNQLFGVGNWFLISQTKYILKRMSFEIYNNAKLFENFAEFVNRINSNEIVSGTINKVHINKELEVILDNGQIGVVPANYHEYNNISSLIQLIGKTMFMKIIFKSDTNLLLSIKDYKFNFVQYLNSEKELNILSQIIKENEDCIIVDLGYGLKGQVGYPFEPKVFKKLFNIGDRILVTTKSKIRMNFLNKLFFSECFLFNEYKTCLLLGIFVRYIKVSKSIVVAIQFNKLITIKLSKEESRYFQPGEIVIIGKNIDKYEFVNFLKTPYKIDFNQIEIPALSGMYLNDAIEKMDKIGINYLVTYVNTDADNDLMVMHTEPEVNNLSKFPKNIIIKIYVNKVRSNYLVMPDFASCVVSEAINFLTQNSVKYKFLYDDNDRIDNNTIIGTEPKANQKIELNQTVTIIVPRKDTSPFQIYENDRDVTLPFYTKILNPLDFSKICIYDWNYVILKIILEYGLVNRRFLINYFILHKLKINSNAIDRFLEKCFKYKIILFTEIYSGSTKSCRIFSLNPNVLENIEKFSSVSNTIHRNYRLIDAVYIKAVLSVNQASLYFQLELLNKGFNKNQIKQFNNITQYIIPDDSTHGFIKIYSCQIVYTESKKKVYFFESIRQFYKTQYIKRKRLAYPEDYIDKILRYKKYISARKSFNNIDVFLCLICENKEHQKEIYKVLLNRGILKDSIKIKLINDLDTNISNETCSTNIFDI